MKKNVFLLFTVVFFSTSCIVNQKTSSLDLQAKCSSASKASFDNMVTAYSKGGINNLTYQNHYNSQKDKCYLLVQGFDAAGKNYELYDTYENKQIASCESFSRSPEIDFCNFNGSVEKYDINKFNDYIKQYLSN